MVLNFFAGLWVHIQTGAKLSIGLKKESDTRR